MTYAFVLRWVGLYQGTPPPWLWIMGEWADRALQTRYKNAKIGVPVTDPSAVMVFVEASSLCAAYKIARRAMLSLDAKERVEAARKIAGVISSLR